MTDMIVGFLFILMVLLLIFANQVSDNDLIEVENTIQTDVTLESMQTEYETKITEMDRDLKKVQEKRRELETRFSQVNSKLQISDASLNSLRARFADISQKMDSKITEAVEKDREIEKLKAEVRDLTTLVTEKGPGALEEYLSRLNATRENILRYILDEMLFRYPELQISISRDGDALHFQGAGLFESGSSEIRDEQMPVIREISDILDDILPCYTAGGAPHICRTNEYMVEAVLIEGHTDSDGSDAANLELSTDRANKTFLRLLEYNPRLIEYKNLKSEPVMSVAGFGEMRPVADNNTDIGKSRNRRIDLRIIMATPSSTAEMDRISEILKGDAG